MPGSVSRDPFEWELSGRGVFFGAGVDHYGRQRLLRLVDVPDVSDVLEVWDGVVAFSYGVLCEGVYEKGFGV